MSHAGHHNVLTGTKEIKDKESFEHIVSVRADKLAGWQEKGYEIIESSEDAHLIGKRKAA